jgi:hypothetical protein
MKTLNDVLLSQPEMRFEIDNDEQAKQFLVEFGLTGQIKTDIVESRTQMLSSDKHKTHNFVVMYFSGKTVPTDNGYLIYCLPKAHFPKDKFVGFLRQMGALHEDVVTIRPLNDDAASN